MSVIHARESAAWAWLLTLQRLDWQQYENTELDRQVEIHLIPGNLGANSGAPMVHVSVSHPDLDPGQRVHASGNNLAKAVQDLYYKLKDQGVEVRDIPHSVAFA